MKEEYTYSEIFKYEGITREYCVKYNNSNLSIEKLIELSYLEEEFNVDYAFYLRFKRLAQIKEFIGKRDIGILNSLPYISHDILLRESVFDSQIDRYRFPNEPSIYDKLNVSMNEKRWDLVFYIFYRESYDIESLITDYEEKFRDKKELRDKKFFIIQ